VDGEGQRQQVRDHPHGGGIGQSIEEMRGTPEVDAEVLLVQREAE